MSNPSALVQNLRNYHNILRDDGLSYGDCVEQSDPAVAGRFLKALGDERCNR